MAFGDYARLDAYDPNATFPPGAPEDEARWARERAAQRLGNTNRQQGDGAERSARLMAPVESLVRAVADPIVTEMTDYSRSRVAQPGPMTEEEAWRINNTGIGRVVPEMLSMLALRNPLGKISQAELRGGTLYAGGNKRLGETAALDAPRAAYVMPSTGAITAGDTRASTRFPTAAKSTENPLAEHLSIGVPEMMASPGFEHNMGLLSTYPGFKKLAELNAPQAARGYVDQAAGNMQYLFDRSPDVMKARAPHWYEGANEISDAFARRWGVPRPSSSGALAALSPQMDWYKNGSLGERVGDIMTSAAAGRKMTPEMDAYVRSVKRANPGENYLQGDANALLLRRIRGKTLDQLDDPLDKALWIRLYDEAHNPRNYRSITPEGQFGDWITNKGGERANVGWGGLNSIEKAVTMLGSGGDMSIISPALGNKHKVRSFYNNIEVPNYPRYGDITADTHQVAAAQMRPLSGSSPAVGHSLASGGAAGSVNPMSSAVTGVQGLYGLTADATRKFASDNNMLARAGQSSTWEPIRGLFTPEWKRNIKNVTAVDDIWRLHDAGAISLDQARDAIFSFAGGVRTPEWARPGLKSTPANQGSTYR